MQMPCLCPCHCPARQACKEERALGHGLVQELQETAQIGQCAVRDLWLFGFVMRMLICFTHPVGAWCPYPRGVVGGGKRGIAAEATGLPACIRILSDPFHPEGGIPCCSRLCVLRLCLQWARPLRVLRDKGSAEEFCCC